MALRIGPAHPFSFEKMTPRLVAVALLIVSPGALQADLFFDDFESGLQHWQERTQGDATIVAEPGGSNHVLQLTPRENGFSHVLLTAEVPSNYVRMEGRFLFPTEGDGYLGFIHNYRRGQQRTDFGVLYVKSNGSYVRVSPHFDGNPSWRLYPEMEVPLTANRRIRTGAWHTFRLEVRAHAAALFIDDFSDPVVEFDQTPNAEGMLGLEARPGFGESVWVDDVSVSAIDPAPNAVTHRPEAPRRVTGWQFRQANPDAEDNGPEFPELSDSGWSDVAPDSRGALITGKLTQYASGPNTMAYLRSFFVSGKDELSGWLALSSANRIDIWLDGSYLGTVAPQTFIWGDHLSNPEHLGARLPLHIAPGRHELVFRVYGRRFAGGGFFTDIIFVEPAAAHP